MRLKRRLKRRWDSRWRRRFKRRWNLRWQSRICLVFAAFALSLVFAFALAFVCNAPVTDCRRASPAHKFVHVRI